MATANEVLKAVEAVDGRLESLDDRNEKGHDAILKQLERMNGTQREHAVCIAEMRVTQENNVERLGLIERGLEALRKCVTKIEKSRAWEAGRNVVIIGLALLLLQYAVLPIIKHIFAGG